MKNSSGVKRLANVLRRRAEERNYDRDQTREYVDATIERYENVRRGRLSNAGPKTERSQ